MKRVYFAQRMDGLPIEEVHANYDRFRKALPPDEILLINTAKNGVFSDKPSKLSRSKAARIVEHDLSLLKQADLLLVDYSLKGWNYVGCTCEVVYAHLWGKPVIVFTGNSTNADRTWLKHLSTRICNTFDDAIHTVLDILELRMS